MTNEDLRYKRGEVRYEGGGVRDERGDVRADEEGVREYRGERLSVREKGRDWGSELVHIGIQIRGKYYGSGSVK